MDFEKVVYHSDRGHKMTVLCQLPGKVKTQARKVCVKCPDTQMESFYMAGANLVYIGSDRGDFEFDADAIRLALAIIRINVEQNAFTRVFTVNLSHHGEIETTKQMSVDCRDIRRPIAASHLNHARHTQSQVSNKVIGIFIITLDRQMRDNQLRAPVNARKHLEVTA